MSNEQEIIQALEETIVNTENVNQDYKKVLTTTGEVDVTLADGSTTPNLNKRVRTVIGEVPMITDGNVSLEDGGNQREFNKKVIVRVESIADMLAIKNPKDGDVVETKAYYDNNYRY